MYFQYFTFVFLTPCLIRANEDSEFSFHTDKTSRISVALPHSLPTTNTNVRWMIVPVEDNPHCEKDDKMFKEGEVYRKDHVIYKCERGYMYPKGCFMSNGKELKMGEKFFDYPKNSLYECYGADMRIGYKERHCGAVQPCPEFPADKRNQFKPAIHYRLVSQLMLSDSVPSMGHRRRFVRDTDLTGQAKFHRLYDGTSEAVFPGRMVDGRGDPGPEVKKILQANSKGRAFLALKAKLGGQVPKSRVARATDLTRQAKFHTFYDGTSEAVFPGRGLDGAGTPGSAVTKILQSTKQGSAFLAWRAKHGGVPPKHRVKRDKDLTGQAKFKMFYDGTSEATFPGRMIDGRGEPGPEVKKILEANAKGRAFLAWRAKHGGGAPPKNRVKRDKDLTGQAKFKMFYDGTSEATFPGRMLDGRGEPGPEVKKILESNAKGRAFLAWRAKGLAKQGHH